MPYIDPERRVCLPVSIAKPETSGELHYLIARILDTYVLFHGQSYRTFNDVMGVLACAQQEFYRRLVVDYEEKKRKANGDVYTTRLDSQALKLEQEFRKEADAYGQSRYQEEEW